MTTLTQFCVLCQKAIASELSDWDAVILIDIRLSWLATNVFSKVQADTINAMYQYYFGTVDFI